jgi:hypothetical protein
MAEAGGVPCRNHHLKAESPAQILHCCSMAGELKKQIQREIKGDRRRHRERSGGFVLVWQHGCLAK